MLNGKMTKSLFSIK